MPKPTNSQYASSVCQEAHRLLDLGYTPIPALPSKKCPAVSWKKYQAAPPTHDELERLFKNHPEATGLGIVTTDLVIIDVDALKNGDPNPFPEDPEHRMLLSVAPAVDTPGGGTHYYFRAPAEKIENSVSQIASCVDIRSSGGFLVVPPTSRAEGAYSWWGGDPINVPPSQLPELPLFISELLISPHPKAKASLDPQEKAIPTGKRNDTLFRLASKWRGWGHSQREILELLRLNNIKKCDPPLEDSELKTIAQSAGKYIPNEPIEPVVDHPDPGPIPERLLEIPGFVSLVMDLTLSTAPRPNKPLAFAGALTLLATLAGRKVRTESDLRTNIYLMALGASGIGKDHPRKINKRIMFEIGLGNSVLGSIASGQALEDEIAKTPSCLAMTDEMDEFLMAIRKDKSGTRQNLAKVMMELFTSASGPYQTRAKASQDRVHIHQPNFCLLGTAVPERFYESISARMMDDGFLGRSLVIEAGKLGPRQRTGVIDLPEDLIAVAQYWANFGTHHDWDHRKPVPLIVQASGDGLTVLEQAADNFDEVRNRANEAGDQSSVSIWARAGEHASKLALLYAISENHEKPEISAAAANWAVEFVGHHARRLIATVHGRVAENEFHALLIKAKTKLQSSPNQCMTRSRLIKNMHISARDLDQVMTVLIEGREVEALVGGTNAPNKSGTVYRLVGQ